MLTPVPSYLDRNGRYSNQQQRSGENHHSGSEQGGAVHHGARHDQDQPDAAACYPQHGSLHPEGQVEMTHLRLSASKADTE